MIIKENAKIDVILLLHNYPLESSRLDYMTLMRYQIYYYCLLYSFQNACQLALSITNDCFSYLTLSCS